MGIRIPEPTFSYISGGILAGSLFLLLDAHLRDALVDNPGHTIIQWYNYIPSVVTFIGMVMLNAVPMDELANEGGLGDSRRANVARVWTFFSFCVKFLGLIIAVIILSVQLKKHTGQDWPPTAMLVSNLMIFASSVVFWVGRAKFLRRGDDYSMY